ncbi:glycosyltransferase family 4 protein [Paenarthrobacter sp. DKR-5]|uniref:glycosyltransferase family 4 protein n=1 Tax=Paenarthrobacter sp. DKR-5 TaxID=2835535 RepID=UPI001BDD03FF|nr:glycosyltransferase family 4 protein [Paenarthrobacter sp. DKR-5]MBT1002784.1 glycosyltransferase family 4 protein [Paenarthrobacter sp. DKR-5]
MKVAIIHPWFPQYREAFFTKLLSELAVRGILLRIYYGETPPEWSARGDSLTPEMATRLPTRFFRIGSKDLVYKSLRKFDHDGPFDLVIVEQAVRNLETYLLMAKYAKRKIAFWGHGKTYTVAVGPLQEKLKRRITMRSSWFFAYTPGGAQTLTDIGYPASRITTVMNSIDTEELSRSTQEIGEEEVEDFRETHGLTGRTALFMGGLDASKRLPFLIAAADVLAQNEPDFRLLVIGEGSERRIIDDAIRSRPWLVYLGRAQGKEKALALAASDTIAMPGRVGLVAVDSFVAGRPIVTTNWPFHAPEFEYLVSGYNSCICENSVEAFSKSLQTVLYDDTLRARLRRGARESAEMYTVDNMVGRFAQGIEEALRQGTVETN